MASQNQIIIDDSIMEDAILMETHDHVMTRNQRKQLGISSPDKITADPNANVKKRKTSENLSPEITPSTQQPKKTKEMAQGKVLLPEATNTPLSVTPPTDKLDLIISNQNQIFSQLSEIKNIQSQVTALTSRVQANTSELGKLRDHLGSTDRRVEEVASEVDILKTISDHLEYELKKLNLTVVGFTEGALESAQDLAAKMNTFLSGLTGQDIKVAEATRFGPLSAKRSRTIRVRFNTMTDRDSVYNARFSTSHPTYINEDLPANLFKTLMSLKRKAKILRATGHQNVKVNLFKSNVQTDNKLFTLTSDNHFIEEDLQFDVCPSTATQRSNSFLGRRN